jgi:hypothetical protein
VATTGFAQSLPLVPQNLSIDYNQHRRTSPAAARAVRSGTRNLGTSNAVSNVAWAHSDAISNLGWATAAINHDWTWGAADITRAVITDPWESTVNGAADIVRAAFTEPLNIVASGVASVASLFTAPPPPMPTE